jgi:penicillin-binding protein 2
VRTEAERERTFSRRALILGAAQGAVGLGLAGRMAYLAIAEGDRYSLLAEDNRVAMRLILPRRGWIVDRRGQPLALNRPDYRVGIVADQVEDLEVTLAALSQFIPITEADKDRIRAEIKARPRFMTVEVARDIPWEAFAAINVRLPELPGVQTERGFSRLYPGGARFGHLLGYVAAPSAEQYEATRDRLLLVPGFKVGKDGIERMLDHRLIGQPGAKRIEVNARGRPVRDLDLRHDTPGETVTLTIDRNLQDYAARRLGEESASVIVIDCWTGDLLCMLSMPAFDSNTFSDGISHAEWDALQGDERHPLINKTVQGLYPPGSTFKMMTALALLEAGISPASGVVCRGRYRFGGHAFHCWSRRGHGGVNMYSGLYQSCDTYFYHFSSMIGVDAIAAMARRFGLGQEFRLPLPSQSDGTVPDEAWKQKRYGKPWLPGETLSVAIGQGYLTANPLQLAVMTARLASGRAIVPRLLAGQPSEPAPLLDIPVGHLDIMRQSMTDVVNSGRGTARSARLRLEGVQLAGKTGTAQVRRITAAERRRGVISNERLPWRFRDHALFVAFAPADQPRYAASIIVEHGGSGSKAAAPIARDVMTFLFDPDRALASLAAIEEQREQRQAQLAAIERQRQAEIERRAQAAPTPPPQGAAATPGRADAPGGQARAVNPPRPAA